MNARIGFPSLRFLFILSAFACGLFIPPDQRASILQGVVSGLFLIVVPQFLLRFVVWVGVAGGIFTPPWPRPDRYSNPFNPWNPLAFLQLFSHCCALAGLGTAISVYWSGVHVLSFVIAMIGAAIGFQIALFRLMAIYSPTQNMK